MTSETPHRREASCILQRTIYSWLHDASITDRPVPGNGAGANVAGKEALARTRSLRAQWAAAALAGWTENDARTLIDLIG